MNSNDIAGTWELVSWQQLDGTLEHPYGTDPVGYLTYHSERDYLALQVMKASRPRVSLPFLGENYFQMSSKDKATAAEEFLGYAGQYTIQDDTVTHNIEISFNPNLGGAQQEYRYQLSENMLTLSSQDGKQQTVWQRAKPNDIDTQILPQNNIVGVWKLVSLYADLDGFLARFRWMIAEQETSFWTKMRGQPIIYPHGQDASGYIMYNKQGYMSAHVMNANRPRLTSAENLIHANEHEKAQATHTYLSYAGPYSLRSDRVIHQPTLSLFPNFVRADLMRFINLSGNELTLSAIPVRRMGSVMTPIIVWERVI